MVDCAREPDPPTSSSSSFPNLKPLRATMASDLSAIASLPQRERQAAYSALLPALYASPLPGLVDLIGHLVQDHSVSLVAGRQVLTELVEGIREGQLGAAGGDEREVRKDVLERAVAAVGGQAGNYDEQVRTSSSFLLLLRARRFPEWTRQVELKLIWSVVYELDVCRCRSLSSSWRTFWRPRRTGRERRRSS